MFMNKALKKWSFLAYSKGYGNARQNHNKEFRLPDRTIILFIILYLRKQGTCNHNLYNSEALKAAYN